jgi:hypothetical protein
MLAVLFFLLNSMQAILERYSKSSDGVQPGNDSEVEKKKKPLMEHLASLVAFSFFFLHLSRILQMVLKTMYYVQSVLMEPETTDLVNFWCGSASLWDGKLLG